MTEQTKVMESAKYSFEIPPEPVAESEITEEISVDLCIVDAGQAGTLAALTAAKMGASAVVLQKTRNVFCYGRVANLRIRHAAAGNCSETFCGN